MRDPVLDPGILRFAIFSLTGGLSSLLSAVATPAARVPAEVYNGDEDNPLSMEDVGLSVLAREIRSLRCQVDALHWSKSQRECAALRNAERLRDHLKDGSLIIDALRPSELPRRELLRDRYGIGRGEAASLVLAERHDAAVVYLSPESLACDVALREGVRFVAVRQAVAA